MASATAALADPHEVFNQALDAGCDKFRTRFYGVAKEIVANHWAAIAQPAALATAPPALVVVAQVLPCDQKCQKRAVNRFTAYLFPAASTITIAAQIIGDGRNAPLQIGFDQHVLIDQLLPKHFLLRVLHDADAL